MFANLAGRLLPVRLASRNEEALSDTGISRAALSSSPSATSLTNPVSRTFSITASDNPAFGVNHYHRVLRGLDDRSHSRDLPFGAFLFADIAEEGGGARQPSALVVETRNRDRYFQSAAILLERRDFGMVHRERAATLGRGEFTSHPRPRAVAPLGRISRSTRSASMASAALNPNSLSAAVPARHLAVHADAQNPVFRDLTSDASRACSRSSFTNSEMSRPIAPIVSILPRASWLGKSRALGTHTAQPEALRHIRACYLLERGRKPFGLVRREKIENGPLERSFRRHAEEPFGSPVPAYDSAVEAGPNDGISRAAAFALIKFPSGASPIAW